MSAMSGMPMPGGWTMSMTWMRMPGQTWPGTAASFLGMWVVMMVAMMLPSLVPVLGRYRRVVPTTSDTRLGLLTALVGVGYFFVWAVFGVFAFVLGAALAAMEMGQPLLARAVPIATGVVAIITGALQFTAWKARYLACCRSAFARTDVGELRRDLATRPSHRSLLQLLLRRADGDPAGSRRHGPSRDGGRDGSHHRRTPRTGGERSRARSGRLSWPPGWFWWRAPFDEILALHQLLECEVHVDHRPGQRCAAIFHVGQQFFLREDRELRFQVSRNLLGASLPHPRSRGLRPIELRVFTESGPGVDVTVPFNHGVDVGNSLERLLERVGQRDHAAAGHRVDEGAIFQAKMSPAAMARSAGNTTNASPFVWPAPK